MNVAMQIYGNELKAVRFFMLASLCGMVPRIEEIPDIFNQFGSEITFGKENSGMTRFGEGVRMGCT